uniref:Uncharacterized protein n=1 Tax=Anguilla anguilla TaxID=7936 RepID=A0A0E9QS78_ANGAN
MQGCPTLFLEVYQPAGPHSNPSKAHLTQVISSLMRSQAAE